MLHSTDHICLCCMGVQASKVPHLVSIVPYAGKDVPKSAKGEHSLALQAYPGPLKYPYMMMWLMELAYVAGK